MHGHCSGAFNAAIGRSRVHSRRSTAARQAPSSPPSHMPPPAIVSTAGSPRTPPGCLAPRPRPALTAQPPTAMAAPAAPQADWEASKENFQPLKAGRKGAALRDSTAELRSQAIETRRRCVCRRCRQPQLQHCRSCLPAPPVPECSTLTSLNQYASACCSAFWEELAGYCGNDPLEVWLRCRQLQLAWSRAVPRQPARGGHCMPARIVTRLLAELSGSLRCHCTLLCPAAPLLSHTTCSGSSSGRKRRLAPAATRRSCCRCWSGARGSCRGGTAGATRATSATCACGSSM